MHHLRAHPRQIQPASHPPCRSPIASIPLSHVGSQDWWVALPMTLTGFQKGQTPLKRGGGGRVEVEGRGLVTDGGTLRSPPSAEGLRQPACRLALPPRRQAAAQFLDHLSAAVRRPPER